MDGACCSKPSVKTITVGTLEVGLMGLDEILSEAFRSGLRDEHLLKEKLIALSRQHGNYISPRSEGAYGTALLGEYQAFQSTKAQKK
jgi:hypothetical protein